MAIEFKLPDVGEGVAEGEIVQWKVKAGDTVSEDDPLVEVMTDKATVEISSPAAGKILELRAAEGEVIAVGSVIVVIGKEGEAAPPDAGEGGSREEAPRKREPEMAAASTDGRPAATPGARGAPSDRPRAAPAVRKRARKMGIDLQEVRGSGPGGRITAKDLDAHSGGKAATAPEAPPAPARPRPRPLAPGEREERVPLRGIRRKIAEHLSRSKRVAPHFTYVDEVDMTEVVALREDAKGIAEERGVKLTYLPFVIRALVPALREFPLLNASLDDASEEIVIRRYYNIGIAVGTDAGLVVPVVRDADQKGILDLAAEIQDLAGKARDGKLQVSDLQGGTFTITSTGNIGGLHATPIINHPEVAILGVHKIAPRPVVREGEIVIRQVMNVSLSFDHRVVDGAVGAAFANRLIRYLQDPKLLLLESI